MLDIAPYASANLSATSAIRDRSAGYPWKWWQEEVLDLHNTPSPQYRTFARMQGYFHYFYSKLFCSDQVVFFLSYSICWGSNSTFHYVLLTQKCRSVLKAYEPTIPRSHTSQRTHSLQSGARMQTRSRGRIICWARRRLLFRYYPVHTLLEICSKSHWCPFIP